ncbi:MAG: GFA family protein [Rhodobacteraceae bacterium]|nr:GFA family protein [Paracoccaceae bacterium]
MEGRCLCGAVRITAVPLSGGASACHCAMCRRWSGAAMWAFAAAAADVRVTGEVRAYRSSPFAERAFCPACGTHLWIRDDGKDYELMPGLFEAARGLPLVREVYADRAFACVGLLGSHPRVSRADYEASRPHVEGDAP